MGLRHQGIPWSGCLTPVWQQLANALVNNPLEHSVIECWEGGLQFTTGSAPTRLAVLADKSAKITIDTDQHKQQITPGQSYTLMANSQVTVHNTGAMRHAIVAISGLQVKSQLGSTSTYAKAALGGICGDVLQQGNTLALESNTAGAEHLCDNPVLEAYRSSVLRVVLGPQEDHFSATGIQAFLSGDYTLGADADRMGIRLDGPTITHRDDAARDIVSDAIMPGSIQVPGTGKPIVLLNDAHTAGGYPKIATVISIDLPLLGLQRAGAKFHFEAISIDEAIAAIRQQHVAVANAITTLQPVIQNTISNESLFTNNLIDGVTDGNI